MSIGTKIPTLKPLELKCTQTDCDADLHCFRQKTKRAQAAGAPCRACGQELIDFPRVQARRMGDIEHTFQSLRREWIRHELWERPFDLRALNHAARKGAVALREREIEKRLRQSVGRAQHPREGRQTPFEGNVLYYAQHSVAACCRRCIEYWHGIPMGSPLTDDEVAYLRQLIARYLAVRLPTLSEQPTTVPPIRRATGSPAARFLPAKVKQRSPLQPVPRSDHG